MKSSVMSTIRLSSSSSASRTVQGLLLRLHHSTSNHHCHRDLISNSSYSKPSLPLFPSFSSSSSTGIRTRSLFEPYSTAAPTTATSTASSFPKTASFSYNPCLFGSIPKPNITTTFSPSNHKGFSPQLFSSPLKARAFWAAPAQRHFSSYFGAKFGLNGDFTKRVLQKPATAFTSAFSRYRQALGLQIDSFFRRNYLFLFGAGGILLCALLWRIMFGIANTFVGLSEGMAKYGFLALSSAIVAFAGLYIRSRITINPDKVYRMAMRKLNTSAGILEVMGAPLTGTEIRAYVMSGGGLSLKTFKPRMRSKRCFLIFPIQGSERRGLVSVEVKKKKGQYDMRLLAVDIPMASGPDQRLFLVGDEEEYRVGGGLISEMRDPVVKAMAAAKEFDDIDEIEEEEEAERERQEAEEKHRKEIEKLEKGGS